MIELTGLGPILSGIGVIYWLLGAYLFYFATTKASTHRGRVILGTVVVIAFVFFPLKFWIEQTLYNRDHKARLAKTKAVIAERCKTAGEKIYRTVEGVDGIMLMKLRTNFSTYDKQADDPFGYMGNAHSTGDYILSFLMGADADGYISKTSKSNMGYKYVEAIDSSDGKRYRYEGVWRRNPEWASEIPAKLQLNRMPAPTLAPRYGVEFEDITKPNERDLWIAGSSFKVIDLETKEILAERIGYMYDEGLGNSDGGRQPWAFARIWSCPSFEEKIGDSLMYRNSWDRQFTIKTLKVSGAENE